MDNQQHYQALINMYLAAPINGIFKPQLQVAHGEATDEMTVKSDFFHAGRALHGCVYFKMLDDAAFFAANSLEKQVFVLTSSSLTFIITISLFSTREINFIL